MINNLIKCLTSLNLLTSPITEKNGNISSQHAKLEVTHQQSIFFTSQFFLFLFLLSLSLTLRWKKIKIGLLCDSVSCCCIEKALHEHERNVCTKKIELNQKNRKKLSLSNFLQVFSSFLHFFFVLLLSMFRFFFYCCVYFFCP